MKKLVFLFSSLMIFASVHAEIYKWIDSQGNVHFSDTPHDGSEKVQVQDTQSFSTPDGKKGKGAKEEEPVDKDKRAYTKVSITQPENEATIRNNQGYLVVSAQLEPELTPGDKLQLLFDGAPLGDPQSALLFQLNGIFRGTHTISVQVQDPSGAVLGSSDTITVYIHRPQATAPAKK